MRHRKYTQDPDAWRMLGSEIIRAAYEHHKRCRRGLLEYGRACTFFGTMGAKVLCDFVRTDHDRIKNKIERECKHHRKP